MTLLEDNLPTDEYTCPTCGYIVSGTELTNNQLVGNLEQVTFGFTFQHEKCPYCRSYQTSRRGKPDEKWLVSRIPSWEDD